MHVFDLRDRLIDDDARFAKSFINMNDDRIREHVEGGLRDGAAWPEPLVRLRSRFCSGKND